MAFVSSERRDSGDVRPLHGAYLAKLRRIGAARLFRCQSRTFANSSEEKSSGLAPSTPSSKRVPWGEKICFRRPIIEPQLQIEEPRSPVEGKRLHRLSAGTGPLRVTLLSYCRIVSLRSARRQRAGDAARRVASRIRPVPPKLSAKTDDPSRTQTRCELSAASFPSITVPVARQRHSARIHGLDPLPGR